MAAMTGNAIQEALEPFAMCGDILKERDGWDESDTLSLFTTDDFGDADCLIQTFKVRDLRRARTAYDAIGSGVNALPWAKRPNGRDWFAATEVGQYAVGEVRDEYKALLRRITDDGQDQDIVVGKASTESEAKAAAQADFERRVLSYRTTHTAAGAVPADVRALVIAARNVAFDDAPSPEALKALDDASEAFAARVPWEDAS